MEIEDPKRVLPHRPPILMLERVVEIVPGVSGTGIRRFVAESGCFEGHFPDHPLVPGVLLIEALAQTAMAVLCAGSEERPKQGFLAKVRDAAFYRPVTPGQEIRFEVEIVKKIKRFYMVRGLVMHGETRCARAELTLAM